MSRGGIDYSALGVPKPGKRRSGIDRSTLAVAPATRKQREPKGERRGLRIYTELAAENPERKAWLEEEQFGGDHGEWIRRLPCLTCFPNLYPGKGLLKPFLMKMGPSRISEASHIGTRGAGYGAAAQAPQCTACHRAFHQEGRETFCERRGIKLEDLEQRAAWLYDISPFRTEVES